MCCVGHSDWDSFSGQLVLGTGLGFPGQELTERGGEVRGLGVYLLPLWSRTLQTPGCSPEPGQCGCSRAGEWVVSFPALTPVAEPSDTNLVPSQPDACKLETLPLGSTKPAPPHPQAPVFQFCMKLSLRAALGSHGVSLCWLHSPAPAGSGGGPSRPSGRTWPAHLGTSQSQWNYQQCLMSS